MEASCTARGARMWQINKIGMEIFGRSWESCMVHVFSGGKKMSNNWFVSVCIRGAWYQPYEKIVGPYIRTKQITTAHDRICLFENPLASWIWFYFWWCFCCCWDSLLQSPPPTFLVQCWTLNGGWWISVHHVAVGLLSCHATIVPHSAYFHTFRVGTKLCSLNFIVAIYVYVLLFISL